MSVTQRLVFDSTDADTRAASSNVGAHIRAGDDGTVIGHVGDRLKVDADITVTDLDIRDLSHTQDSIRLGDGTDLVTTTTVGADIGLDVNILNASLTVDATDLDIRDLSAASDSVAAWLSDGSGNAIGSTGGSLDVNVTNSIDVDDGLADTDIENTQTLVSNTAINVVSSPLPNRKYLGLANEDNKSLYWGKTGVTATNGFPLHPGMQFVGRIGPSVPVQVIGEASASNEDLRVVELS
jgi:hypothetical protein